MLAAMTASTPATRILGARRVVVRAGALSVTPSSERSVVFRARMRFSICLRYAPTRSAAGARLSERGDRKATAGAGTVTSGACRKIERCSGADHAFGFELARGRKDRRERVERAVVPWSVGRAQQRVVDSGGGKFA